MEDGEPDNTRYRSITSRGKTKRTTLGGQPVRFKKMTLRKKGDGEPRQ